jgi:large subunit ribosomal protein L22
MAVQAHATAKYVRTSAQKAGLVMDLIRGRDVDDALSMLKFSKQRVSGMIEKVIRSAVANANEQETANIRNTLYVAKAWVDPGPVIKRFQPKDRGKAYPINKRTSHLVVSIDERGEGAAPHRHPQVVGGRPGKAR